MESWTKTQLARVILFFIEQTKEVLRALDQSTFIATNFKHPSGYARVGDNPKEQVLFTINDPVKIFASEKQVHDYGYSFPNVESWTKTQLARVILLLIQQTKEVLRARDQSTFIAAN